MPVDAPPLSRPLRITLASWAPFVAGAEVAVERLASGLMEAGHEVELLVGTNGAALERFRDQGLRCHFIEQQFTGKLNWLRYRAARNKIGAALAKFGPDIVHSNDLPTHQIYSDAARRIPLPRICHHRWLFEGPAIDWFNKFSADHHIFVSHSIREYMCARSSRLAGSSQAIVHDGLKLPPTPSENDRALARHKLKLVMGRSVVLFVGQVIERKGVDDLLRAWSMLGPMARQPADLVIVGDDLETHGAYRQAMENLAAELQLDVRFAGFQKDIDVWMSAADIVVVPSHAEPLGLVVLEGMAHARPVIGSNVGGIPEIIVHNTTGILVPPRDPLALAAALRPLLEHEQLRIDLGISGRRRCERVFSLESHVSAMEGEYQRVLQQCEKRKETAHRS